MLICTPGLCVNLEFVLAGLVITLHAVWVSHWMPSDDLGHVRTLYLGFAMMLEGELAWLLLSHDVAGAAMAVIGTAIGGAALSNLHALVLRKADRVTVYAVGTLLAVVFQSALFGWFGRLVYAPVVLAFGLMAGAADGLSYGYDRVRNWRMIALADKKQSRSEWPQRSHKTRKG